MMSPSYWFTTEDGEDGFEEALRPPIHTQVVKVKGQHQSSVVLSFKFIMGNRKKVNIICFKNSIK